MFSHSRMASRLGSRLDGPCGPFSIDRSPGGTCWVFIPQYLWQSRLADRVVTRQFCEAQEAGWNPDRRESWVAGCGIWSTMIHGGANSDTGGHFVVQ